MSKSDVISANFLFAETSALQDYARFREVMGYLDRILRERQKQFVALLERRRAEAAKADASES